MRPLEATPTTGIDVTPQAILALQPHLAKQEKGASAVRITVSGYG